MVCTLYTALQMQMDLPIGGVRQFIILCVKPIYNYLLILYDGRDSINVQTLQRRQILILNYVLY